MLNLSSFVQKAQQLLDPTQGLNLSPSDRNPSKASLFQSQFRLPVVAAPAARDHGRADHPAIQCHAGRQGPRPRLPLRRQAAPVRGLPVLLHHARQLCAHGQRQRLGLLYRPDPRRRT